MEWLPFFVNCQGHDQRILLYDLFEHSKACQLVETVKIIEQIPVTGFTPVADNCDVKMTCKYAEPFNLDLVKFTRWFEVTSEQTLYYITSTSEDP